jgi:very-short-patch-repair endonuclease
LRIAGKVLHLDLAWPDARVAIEYEGDHHRTDRAQWHYDIRRYDLLAENGWTVIRATASDYRDAQYLVTRVRRALR